MGLNVSGCHAFRIHGQDLLFYILTDAGLILLQQPRLKLTFPVSGNGDVYRPKAGSQPLGAVSVAAVIRLLVPVRNRKQITVAKSGKSDKMKSC